VKTVGWWGPGREIYPVLRNLWRNRRRMILTVLSIAVSLFVFATLMTLPGFARAVLRRLADYLCSLTAGPCW
jgi:cell division protein FtsX